MNTPIFLESFKYLLNKNLSNISSLSTWIYNTLLERSRKYNIKEKIYRSFQKWDYEITVMLYKSYSYFWYTMDLSMYSSDMTSLMLLLLDKGPNYYKRNIIMYACKTGNLKVVKTLKYHDEGDINVCDLVSLASEYNNIEVLRYLMDTTSHAFYFNCSFILENASCNGYFDIVKLLLTRIAPDKYVNIKTSSKGQYKVLKLLIDHGAKLSRKCLIEACNYGCIKTAKLIIQNGISASELNDIDTIDFLNGLVKKNKIEIVKLLSDNGYRPNHYMLNSALLVACQEDQADFVSLLISLGATISFQILELAIDTNSLKLVKILIENGADIHEKDDIALGIASEKGHIDIVRYLVNQGANIHADDDYALRRAYRYSKMDVFNFLLSVAKEEPQLEDDPETFKLTIYLRRKLN